MSTVKMPLAGLKVLDLSRVYAGPYCTMMLGDLGAEVIKVERPGFGDDTRDFMPVKDGESGYFAYMNRNKKSITLDLKDPKAVEIVKELAALSDIMVENFSPGVVDRLGIGYEDIKKVNPEIIYGSISGFGQYGPYKSKPAYDVVTQAMGGFMAITGEKDGKPYKLGSSIVDASAGIHMAFALMAAVYYKSQTGKGQHIDVAMMDTAFSTLENFVVTKTLTGTAPTRNGNANLGSSPFNCYKTSDGYVTIACANDSLFKKLTEVMNRPDLLEIPEYASNSLRKQNEDGENGLNAQIEAWTVNYKTDELVEMLDNAKIPVGPILDIDDLVEDPHLKARNMLINIPHPVFGDIIYPGNPLKFSLTNEMRMDSAALLGEHTDEILEKVLKKSKKEIAELHESKVV